MGRLCGLVSLTARQEVGGAEFEERCRAIKCVEKIRFEQYCAECRANDKLPPAYHDFILMGKGSLDMAPASIGIRSSSNADVNRPVSVPTLAAQVSLGLGAHENERH